MTITFRQVIGYSVKKLFHAAEKGDIPTSYIERWAKRRELQSAFATARAEDAVKAATREVKHSASAGIKAKRFFQAKREAEEYALGKTYTARTARQRAQRVFFAKQKELDASKTALRESRHEFDRIGKLREYRERKYDEFRERELIPGLKRDYEKRIRKSLLTQEVILPIGDKDCTFDRYELEYGSAKKLYARWKAQRKNYKDYKRSISFDGEIVGSLGQKRQMERYKGYADEIGEELRSKYAKRCVDASVHEWSEEMDTWYH